MPHPGENLIGEEGKGLPYILGALAGGRISHGARSIGVATAAYEASLEYANTRVQFGKPIGKQQDIAFKIARMAVDIEAARWLMYRGAWLYDNGKATMKDPAMSKLFASEMAVNVTNEATQINGGYGYMIDSPVQRDFRDARLFTITEGTSQMQLRALCRGIGL